MLEPGLRGEASGAEYRLGSVSLSCSQGVDLAASQEASGRRTKSRTAVRATRRRTTTATLIRRTMRGEELSGEETASTLRVLQEEDRSGRGTATAPADALLLQVTGGWDGRRRSRVVASSQEQSQGLPWTVTLDNAGGRERLVSWLL